MSMAASAIAALTALVRGAVSAVLAIVLGCAAILGGLGFALGALVK
jgi:hypothetical protein